MNDTQRPRILISRLSAIGDCILTLPVLCALRTHFPDAFLGWVVQEGAAPLIRNHKALDRLIVVKTGWLSSLKEVRRVRQELRALKFEIALDVQSLTKSAVAAWLSGAPSRVGFARPQGRELALWLDHVRVKATKSHVVDRYLELLKPLGIHEPPVSFDVPEDHIANATIEGFLRDADVGHGFAVFSPGAGWPSKVWPADRYRPVSEHLNRRHHLKTVVVWSGKQERAWAEQIVAGSEKYCSLAPRTTLLELAALLRRAALFVGPDTGPLHLAAALGSPCVGLYGPTDPAVCGPYGASHVWIQAEEVKVTRMRSSSDDFMRGISAEAVFRACDTILQRERRSSEAADSLP